MKVFILSINYLFVVVFAIIICFLGSTNDVVFAADDEAEEQASSSVNGNVNVNVNADVQPDEIYSKDGLLDTTLTVDYLVSLNGTRYAPAYNGKSVGPTFRVKPGDTIRITLVNNLSPESDIGRELYQYVLDPNPDDSINQTSKYCL